jgi:hypothetical protein
MILDLDIKDYHNRSEISSTVLKAALVSQAHLHLVLSGKMKTSKSMILGDAVHAFILQPNRFDEMYETIREVYLRNTGEHKAGDAKLDTDGEPIVMLKHKTDSSLDIKGDDYKKFTAMISAYTSSYEATELVKSAKFVETSFIFNNLRVRPDFITEDGWIVDLKTVGGTMDKPSAPERFGRDFFDYGYDLQMYMYYNVVRKELPNIKGFKFLCLDAKIPSGVQIYTFVDGESKWFELGGYRFHEAMCQLDRYQDNIEHRVYDIETPSDLPLSYQAEEYLVKMRAK